MYTILKKELLNSNEIYLMEVRAPYVAQGGKPGQFVIVIPHDKGERVPLTICDIHPERESVDIVYQVVGDTTRHLSQMAVGDRLTAMVGPLGRPSELITAPADQQRQMRLLFVAGGVGIAPVYPQVKWAHEQGIPTDVIIGARNKSLLFFEENLKSVCDNLFVMTDDGSYGQKGLVTEKIKQLCTAPDGSWNSPYTHCVAIGPLPMMKFVARLTKEIGLKTIVSMNCMMVDGTGMCGACRVTVGDTVKFTCVDGPEFDGHLVDFEEAGRRLRTPDARRYRIATADGHADGHQCNLSAAVTETLQRQRPAEQDPAIRATNFDEVSFGFTPEQAVAEARRCLHCKKPMCVTQCPVSIHIPDFIAAVAAGDFAQAAQVIAQDSSLPAICGRVCPQETQCEGSCILGHKGQPIAIGALERFVADWNRQHNPSPVAPQATPNGRRVAIVGSGPTGLTCAADLAKMGYSVTIFEALHHPGGVLVYGIPEFRLPKQKVVEPEIDNLRRLGVEIKTNVIVGKSLTVDDLLDRQGFDAVYIGSGAGLPKFMGVPGETLGGVLSANELLTRTNLMHGYDSHYDTPVYLGRRVAVIGGGNVAMDAARTAKRLGSEVTVIYRREEADMPARREEVHHAKEEGINFEFLTNPVEFLGDAEGNVCGMRCVRMAMGEIDEKGRRKFSPIAGSEFEMETDTIVVALGTSPNPLIKTTTPGLDTESWGGLKADANGQTSRPGVFAGGDAVTGAATVILAMGAGRTAARAIHHYISAKAQPSA